LPGYSPSLPLINRKQTNVILVFRKALLATAFVAGLFASAVFATQIVDEVSQVPQHAQA